LRTNPGSALAAAARSPWRHIAQERFDPAKENSGKFRKMLFFKQLAERFRPPLRRGALS
jgi:hypothetical protein